MLLPQLGDDLGASAGALGAVVSVAALGFAAPLILVGRVSDRVGARRLLLFGVVLFAVSATVCAVADDFSVLLVGPALQGIASACCFTTSLAVIDVIFDADRRGSRSVCGARPAGSAARSARSSRADSPRRGRGAASSP